MSSPFRYFRKHTKVFLAVAAVMAIFIFVVGDALRGAGGSDDRRDAGATVATWNGGSLNEAQLGSLIAQRILVNDFLRALIAQSGVRDQYDLPTSVPLQGFLLASEQLDQVEIDVINTEVLSSLATQAGMAVSDDVINHYIEEVGSKRVSGEQIAGILKNIGQHNARANEAIVFNMLRKLLLAHFYQRTYADASMVVLPQQRWDDWRKVYDRVSVEAAVLPVEKFLAEVPEPTEAQLLAFYNDYKELEPGRMENALGRELPVSTPGFAAPRRVKLQYLLGSVEQRAEKLRDSITEEQIKEYYEDNKRTQFTKSSLPDDALFGSPDATTDSTEPPSAAPAPADGATPPAADAPASETPASVDAPAIQAPPADAPPAADSAPAEAATPAADPAPAPASTEPAPANTENPPSSAVRRHSPFRLAAFQTAPPAATDAAAAGEAAEAAAPPATEAEPATATDAPAEPAAPAESTAAPAAAEAPAAASEAPPATAASDATPAAAQDAATPAPAAAPAEEYEPLDKVRDEIRQALATEKAVDELSEIMNQAAAALQTKYNAYGSEVANANELKKKTPPPPAELTDLKWLADQYGLTAETTAPLTLRELFDTAVGKAGDAASQQVSVTQAAYQSLDLFEPLLAQGLDGDYYLVLKTEDQARRVPPLTEVRDQVIEAWRRAEAAKLAEKKAKELAAEVQKSGAPFDQFFFADRGFEVIKPTAFFSWRSYPVGRGGTGTPPSLSDVPELKHVGPDFMSTVFGLADKEVAALLNSDRSAAYVVRVARRQYTDEELKQLFLEEADIWPGRVDMMREHFFAFNNAVEREILEERAGLELDEEWLKRRAERIQQRQN